MTHRAGRHFLQIPGPTNVPDRVLRAMDMPTIDHRGPEFAQLGFDVIEGSKKIFKTRNPVIIYPSSGTGAWEAAIVNTLSPGDKVLMCETGHFATLWRNMAVKHGLQPEFIASDWRSGADPKALAERFVVELLRDAFGFATLSAVASAVLTERNYPVGFAALLGRVPVVIAPAGSGLDKFGSAFGDGARRRGRVADMGN